MRMWQADLGETTVNNRVLTAKSTEWGCWVVKENRRKFISLARCYSNKGRKHTTPALEELMA